MFGSNHTHTHIHTSFINATNVPKGRMLLMMMMILLLIAAALAATTSAAVDSKPFMLLQRSWNTKFKLYLSVCRCVCE